MEKGGLIRMPGRGRGRPGEGIELTEQGKEEAEALLRQHRLAERFLVDVLGMDWVKAHEEAHNMERGMSPEIEAHLMQLLNNPRTCPHGNPIPMGNFNTLEYLREQHAVRLNTVPEGRQMRVLLISEVVEDETAILTRLGEMDIMPGAKVSVTDSNRQEHTLDVQITPRGERAHFVRTVTLPEDLAAKIWVRD
jgi:DtxR family Mn-dependent transcriptional regulator